MRRASVSLLRRTPSSPRAERRHFSVRSQTQVSLSLDLPPVGVRAAAGRQVAALAIVGLLIALVGVRAESPALPSSLRKQIERDLKSLKKMADGPESGEIWLRVGRAYQELKDYDKASEALAKAAEQLPPLSEDRARSFEELGDLLLAQESDDQARGMYVRAIAVHPCSAGTPLHKMATLGDPLADSQEGEVYETMIRDFFGKDPAADTERIPSDTVELQLEETAPAPVKKAARHPETLWKSLVGAQSESHPNWAVVLELSQKILEMAPDFPEVPQVYLARARAYDALIPAGKGQSSGPEVLRSWIAYGLAIERCKDFPDLHFVARAELAQVYAATGPPGTESILLPLALAHTDLLEKQFPDRQKDLASVLDFIGDQALERKQYEVAIAAYTKIADQETPGQEWLSAPQKLAAAYKAAGNGGAALEWSKRFARGYPDRMEKYLAASGAEPTGKNEGYFKNRNRFAAHNAASDLEEKLLSLSLELGQQDRAEEIRRGLYVDLLGHVPARTQWLKQARSAVEAGKRDEALACYLRALKPARTVLPQMQARHAVNQAYLDELREFQPEEELREIFVQVCSRRCSAPAFRRQGEGPPEGGTTNEDFISAVIKTWQTYRTQERDGERSKARSTLQQFIASLSASPSAFDAAQARPINDEPSTILSLLAHLTLAKSYQQEGIHFRALPAFDRAEAALNESEFLNPEESPSLRYFFTTAITYGRALSYFRRGQYDLAAKEFERVTSPSHSLRRSSGQAPTRPHSHTPTLLPPAAYRIAQCHEFEGEFRKASKAYDRIAQDPATAHELRRLAAFALKRVQSGHSPLATRHSRALYMGENRSDLGNWKYNHPGTEGFILCAMQAPFDIVGGPDLKRPRAHAGLKSLPMAYRLSTTDPKEGGRRWISRLNDPSPSALWNPVSHCHTSSNWDDSGEQRPVGPDLRVGLTVPSGPHRLSLAFVNDHSYFEPSRRYTLYLKDTEGRLLTGCDVEDHLGGVYKHFAVFGPQQIRIHVSRDLSLNTLLSGVFLDPLSPPMPPPDDFAVELDDTDIPRGLAERLKALRKSYQDIVERMTQSPVEYARTCHSLGEVVELAGSFIGMPESTVGQKGARRAKAHAAWIRWQAFRLLAVSAGEERAALQAVTNPMTSLGWESPRVQSELIALRDACLKSGELGRSQLIEDQKLRLLHSEGDEAKYTVALKQAAFFYYPYDRLYALSKFRAVLDPLLAIPEAKQRARALEGLAGECRNHRSWGLAEMTYAAIESSIPLEDRGKEYFRFAFRALSYQGKNRQTIELLKKHLGELPNSTYDLLWRLNLVTHLLNIGQVDEAAEANSALVKSHPGHSSAENLEFLVGMALLQKKKDPEAAKKRFLAIIRESPESYWAKCSRNVLKQLQEGTFPL